MSMTDRRGGRTFLFGFLGCALLATTASGQAPPKDDGTARQILAVTQALAERFNEHDADALAELWQPGAVHMALSSGTKLEGRKAVAAAYRKLFRDDPECRIELRVTSMRRVTPDVVSVDAAAGVVHTDGNVTRSQLSAVLVKTDGQWLLSQVNEADTLIETAENSPLAELHWLVGKWSEGAPDEGVVNEFRWIAGGKFLRRAFVQKSQDQVVREGLQVFGWDPAERSIRCWVFSSDGSFGEGRCTIVDGKSVATQLAVTLPDGQTATFKQVVERLSDDEFTVQTIDRQLEGAPLLNGTKATFRRDSETPPSVFDQGKAGGGGFF